MKRLLPILGIVTALLLTPALAPVRSAGASVVAPAFAAEDHTCDHNGVTIESLQHCVMHAYDMGHIANKGVADSLLANLDAAQAALDRGQPEVAIRLLYSFIREVNAQAGKYIEAEYAGHLVTHAENVIAALGG